MTITQAVGGWLADRTTRRSFLARGTLAATALAVGPADFLLRPTSAYAVVCQCASGNCDCAEACCDGYTDFCCTIDQGANACPPGSFMGGWWKADGSQYCAGARYYIDCMGDCHGCGCPSGFPFCGCDGLTCECALGSCGNRHVGCAEFRYGQCHPEIGCSGRILCRVVTCTPPWVIDSTCSTVAYTDESTANHYAACLAGPITSGPPPVVAMAATPTGRGYWLVDSAGGISVYGDATAYGGLNTTHLNRPIVGMAATRTGHGYWLVASDGGIFTFGDAGFFGSTGALVLNRPVVGMAATASGRGYWLVASDGGVFCFGDAGFSGSTGALRLNRPAVGMAPDTQTGGYWLVASDGGIFAFHGPFDGSTGNLILNRPVVDMAATADGGGYWLAASDGGVFCFGDAPFYGSAGALRLAAPIVGMAATPTGRGYWLVGDDGGIFTYGDAGFFGARP